MTRRTAVPALALLLLAGCGRAPEPAPVGEAPPISGVRVEAVRPEAEADAYEAVGTVRSRASSVLSAKVVGIVVAVHAREGDRVRPGQPLVDVDSRDAQIQTDKARAGLREAEAALDEVDDATRAADQGVAAAEANLALAASTFGRFQELWARRSVSRQEYEEAEARHKGAEAEARRARELRQALAAKRKQVEARRDQAQAEIAGAQVVAGYARVAAPFAGVVAAKSVEVGSLAAPGVPLLTVEEERYRLEASAEESRLAGIRPGQRVAVRIDALPGAAGLTGTVAEVAPAGDSATRSYLVKIDLPPAAGLRSGLFGRARFAAGERAVLRVPRAALVRRGDLAGVFVVGADRTARLRLVTLGEAEGPRVEILSGLSPGEAIAVDGVDRLRDGARVN